ncbi:MAG: MFS transporter, partial [Pseudomonadota bacterium]
LFSGSVGPSEQGWVMGVTVAIYALGSGTITALSGSLMAINLRMPFMIAVACCILALVFMARLFRHPGVQALDKKSS